MFGLILLSCMLWHKKKEVEQSGGLLGQLDEGVSTFHGGDRREGCQCPLLSTSAWRSVLEVAGSTPQVIALTLDPAFV
jgi:hypothetical protein